MAKFKWERIDEAKFLSQEPVVNRAKVPGGWLIWTLAGDVGGLAFLPDPEHSWNGETLDLSDDSEKQARRK